MIMPSPRLVDGLDRSRRDHRAGTRPEAVQARVAGPTPIRVRIGHALIAVGSTLSGERVEIPARPPAYPKAA
jgi:hypothetical protein